MDTRFQDILDWVLGLLRTDLGLNESQAFLSLNSLSPERIPPADWFMTVSPGAGRFIIGEQIAGNVTVQWQFLVRLYARLPRDRAGHGKVLLRDAGGLYERARAVLKTLVGQHNPQLALRGNLAAETIGPVEWLTTAGELHYASMELVFVADFDLDLA